MKLVSWNVAHRVRKQPLQMKALLERDADLIGLQEVTAKTHRLWTAGLSKAGFSHFLSTFDDKSMQQDLRGPRRYGLLVASKWPLNPKTPSVSGLPWPERLLSTTVSHPNSTFEFHVAHIPPGSSHGWLKIDTFNGIYSSLAMRSRMPRILCGDFNSPQAEFEDGEIVTWGQTIGKDGKVNLPERYIDWDKGERSVLEDLAQYDLAELFRLLNGYSRQEFSWIVRRHGKIVSKRRFDHIFAASGLNPVLCEYVHAVRKTGLSDHSAIEAVFQL